MMMLILKVEMGVLQLVQLNMVGSALEDLHQLKIHVLRYAVQDMTGAQNGVMTVA